MIPVLAGVAARVAMSERFEEGELSSFDVSEILSRASQYLFFEVRDAILF